MFVVDLLLILLGLDVLSLSVCFNIPIFSGKMRLRETQVLTMITPLLCSGVCSRFHLYLTPKLENGHPLGLNPSVNSSLIFPALTPGCAVLLALVSKNGFSVPQ